MVDRKEYMKQYREKNRKKINEYQRRYFRDPTNRTKHKEACDNWRKERMSDETREKIRKYQKEYYEQHKNNTQIDL